MSVNPRVRVPVSLRRVCPRASFVGCADVRVSEATHRSEDCRHGSLFAALPGTNFDGADFVDDAVSRGARAVLVRQPLAGIGVPQVVVSSVRDAYARICSAIHGHPTDRLNVVGVTGTNGKSTVTWMVRSILRAAGQRCGLLGTIEYDDTTTATSANLTTPDSDQFFAALSRIAANGARHAAVELSSHALHQDRVAAARLRVAVVTNVTHDHFDYHGTHEDYLAAKSRIAELLDEEGLFVLNADDPAAASLASRSEGRNVRTFGIDEQADVRGTVLDQRPNGTRFRIDTGERHATVELPLAGAHNVSNALAAAASCRHLGIDLRDIVTGLESLKVVPGRLERIDEGQPFEVFVDYAHTPDALHRVVQSLRDLTTGRVICVFGAGGDRDTAKRPELGRAAAQADVAIVTSDNPRSESPERIIEQILPGLADSTARVESRCDRAEAIAHAIAIAQPGDSVLVAGKGHETYQVVGNDTLPFDDREVVRQALHSLHERLPAAVA